MAFRNFRIGFLNAYREAGISALSSGNAVNSSFPLDNVMDDSAGRTMRFNASVNGHTLDINRGAGFASLRGIDRIWLAAGHNININLRVLQHTASDFSGATVLMVNTAVTLGQAFQAEFTKSDEQYIRVQFNDTGLWHVPEIVLSETRTFTRGADLDDANDTLESINRRILHEDGAVSFIELGGPRRRFSATWNRAQTADLTLLQDLIDEVGTSRPFLVDPPSFSVTPDTDEPVRWVRLANDVTQEWATGVTGGGVKKQTFTLVFEDHIG